MSYPSLLAGLSLAAWMLMTTAVHADGSGLPGDIGRPMEGVPPGGHGPPPKGGPPKPPVESPLAPAPPIALATRAAQAIAQGCPQYRLGVAIVNADGQPILLYVPDGARPWHGYSALRKAYTAVRYRAASSEVMKQAQGDETVAAKIRADPNAQAFSGAVLWRIGADIVGAIAVSGAEPGGHDEECALIGLHAIEASPTAPATR